MKDIKSLHKLLRNRVLLYKREWEIELVLGYIGSVLNERNRNLTIMEFGAGSCLQARLLGKFGSVTATDIEFRYLDDRNADGVLRVRSDMQHAPFRSGTFSLVYSNHALEHVKELALALQEARRIATKEALFAFAVPTRVWLLLAQPAVMAGRIAALGWNLRKEGFAALGKVIWPAGHGEYRSFLQAFKAFGRSSWHELFRKNGFHVLCCQPLLLYAPAELLLPPLRWPVGLGLSSSILFMLRKVEAAEGAGKH